MTITVNGEHIDFTLEAEKSVGDVLGGLIEWLDNAGMLIESVRLNGEAAPMAEDAWKLQSIDEVNTLELNAVSRRTARLIQLETARDYFTLLVNSAESGGEEELAELSSGFPDLRTILPHLLDEGSRSAVLARIDSVFAEAGFPLPEGSRVLRNPESLGTEARMIKVLLERRVKELENPEKAAAAAAAALASAAEKLEEAAVKLQTGHDAAAMEIMIHLTELLGAFMRPVSWMSAEREAVKSAARDITGFLAELEEAMGAGDTVLIGDLLEYEIKPRLIELPKLFSPENVR